MDKATNKPTWTLIKAVLTVYAIGLLFSVTWPACSRGFCSSEVWDKASCTTEDFPGSCTTFAASYGDTVLFGNNEDFNNPVTYLWTVPPGEGTYGGVYLGYNHGRPQGGINEKGLAFDALALPEAKLNPHPDLPSKGRGDTQFLGKMLSHSATVEEAIAFAQSFNWGSSVSFQVLLADATGDAVVISAGPDGELAFTRKPEGNSYLVGTNFNRAIPENRWDGPSCLRYDKAEAMLARIESEAGLNADYVQSILDAVHVEGIGENTLYSNVFDLRNGVIYLSYWHQFDEVVTLNVAELITEGAPPVRLSALFSEETVTQAEKEYQQHIDRAARNEWLNQNGKILIAGGGGVILGLLGLIIYLFKRRNKHV